MIRTEREDAVAIITIDRAERRNALDTEHNEALSTALRDAAYDPVVRAIVLTATGSVFCAGADLKDLLPDYRARVAAGESPRWHFGGITGAERLRVPVVAALNGAAIAGGLELALACDLRLCAPEATFTMAEVRWAITPGAGGTQRLPRLVGAGAAADLLLTARSLGAEEALRIGLVDRVVDADRLLDEAVAVAAAIASNGPLAVAAVRDLIVAGADLPLESALELERDEFLRIMRTADAAEGSTAFADRREPRYRGE